jgi:hypothetical protein
VAARQLDLGVVMLTALIFFSFVAGATAFSIGNYIIEKLYFRYENIIWKIFCASFAYLSTLLALTLLVFVFGIYSSKFMIAFLAGVVFYRLLEYAASRKKG